MYELYGLYDEEIDFYIWSYVRWSAEANPTPFCHPYVIFVWFSMVGCTPRAFPMGKPTLHPCVIHMLFLFGLVFNGRLYHKGIFDGKPTLRSFVIHMLFLFGFYWSAVPQGHFRWASQPYGDL